MKAGQFRSIRLKAGHTQKSLAALLAVTATTVARWERGESPVPRAVEILMRSWMK